MDDISNAITILADKVGIGVDTLYQLNLSVQMIKAVSNIITIAIIFILLVVCAIFIYKWDNDCCTFDGFEGKIIIFFVCAICIIFVCALMQYCIEETALRIYAPQYMAMKDTIHMIGDMV